MPASDAPVVNGRTLDWVRSLDPRNDAHLLSAVLPTLVPHHQKLWPASYRHLDQGRVGACTMFAATICRMHTARWKAWRPTPNTDAAGNEFAIKWYHRAQELDEFASTPPADGSSVTGAAKAAREAGIITSFQHARSVDDVLGALELVGPGVMGSGWHSGMFGTDANFMVDVSGPVEGGHAYCLDGYFPAYHGQEVVRGFNSWGLNWGDRGRFYMKVSDLRRLWDDGAEFATFTA